MEIMTYGAYPLSKLHVTLLMATKTHVPACLKNHSSITALIDTKLI